MSALPPVLAVIPAKIALMRPPSESLHVQIHSLGALGFTVSLPLRLDDYVLPLFPA